VSGNIARFDYGVNYVGPSGVVMLPTSAAIREAPVEGSQLAIGSWRVPALLVSWQRVDQQKARLLTVANLPDCRDALVLLRELQRSVRTMAYAGNKLIGRLASGHQRFQLALASLDIPPGSSPRRFCDAHHHSF